jgi:hypothetical protein
MQHYVAREIIRQHTGEMRAQASRWQVASRVRAAQANREEARRGLRTAGRSPLTEPGQATAAEVIPLQRVPDNGGSSSWDAGPRSHAC